jgi:uncharacterized protein YegJ (DUF2314 family)
MSRKFRSLLAVTALALGASVFNSGGALCGLLDATRDGRVVMVPTDDPAMTAAFAKARGALDGFLAKLANPPPRTEGCAIKIPIGDRGEVEYFWLIDLTQNGDNLSGVVNNRPEAVHNLAKGQKIAFHRGDVADWMYFDDGKMIGDFTACAMLSHETGEVRETFRREYGLDCAN